ncbi:MAG TPA: outer membrane beta-barrel protein [Prolixibacteraceae bacterium]|nr:outer membrane beta-barrel protein [Prolixibacteraceae bacterium]
MKRNLVFLVFIIAMMGALPSYSQLYFKAGAGYGAGAQKLLLETQYAATYTENVFASFGGNFGVDLAAGYELNQYVDFEFDLGYQNGRSVTVNQVFSYKTYVGRLIYLGPSLVFKTSINKNISPYGKLGLFTGLPLTKVIVGGTEKTFRGGIPLGYNGALGAVYNLSETFKVYIETYSQSMIYRPTRRRELNGDVVKFKNKLDTPAPSNQELTHHQFSFGALGINMGIKIVF